MSFACNATWTRTIGKDTDRKMSLNRKNAKQSTQKITASPSININNRSTDDERDMAS